MKGTSMNNHSVKFNNLLNHLKTYEQIAVAFSGGTDSTLLLKASQLALNEKVLAITVKTPYIPDWEIEEAISFTRQHNIKHKILDFPFLIKLKENPKDRCYWCKSNLFKFMLKEVQKENVKTLMDGTNLDDLSDYRPGIKAIKELKIVSPFLDMSITKPEIRRFSLQLGLPTWEKPAYACLLTRIPYGQEIKNGELKRIEEAEKYLRSLGFNGSRVRIHGNLARIEIIKDNMPTILSTEMFNQVANTLKTIGFTYVTLDMEGYRMGSHNDAMPE
jgi:pyridinium-3,5-biscarboxylic acid mononucleotide sulfurtransferase